MSVLTLISELISGNIGYILQIFLDHPFWVFGFACASVFMRGKGILGLVIVGLYVWTVSDLASLIGWTWGVVPAFVVITLFSLGIFTDDFKFMGKWAPHAAILIFVSYAIAHNLWGFPL